jgi:hypothetical protein
MTKETWKRIGNYKQGEKERTKMGAKLRCNEKYKNNCDMGNSMMP